MKLLLDTHIFLWWITNNSHLPPAVRKAIQQPSAVIYFSTASSWEISIKTSLGNLILPRSPEEYIPPQILQNGFIVLPMDLRHTLRAGNLPPIHRDPFDRMLVAQAQIEDLTLVTTDKRLKDYKVKILRH